MKKEDDPIIRHAEKAVSEGLSPMEPPSALEPPSDLEVVPREELAPFLGELWDEHVALFSAQIAVDEKPQSIVNEYLLGIFDMIQSLEVVEDNAKSAVATVDSDKERGSDAQAAGTDAQPSAERPGTIPLEVTARSGATRIFHQAPGSKVRAASARVRIPDEVRIGKARISGEGHNQDRDGFLRTMEVKINGRVLKVIPAIRQGQTKSFDMAVPPGVLICGWNDIQAYIEWSNEDYDKGHWVSLTLTLE